jgi:predicted dehydrogenase
MASKKVKVGIVGCGAISGIYLKNLTASRYTEVAACADMLPERAQEAAKKYGVAKACTVKELLADPDIQIVVNLTIPKAHADIAFQCIEAGKSVYNEKPITITREDGKKLLKDAKAKKLLVGGAPDTFLGAGLQTCRKLIDDGVIGKPIAATAFMQCHGHESWHPDPVFYYKAGGGPMFDMGPYYVTALVHLVGPVRKVAGMTGRAFEERIVTSQPKNGLRIPVDVPTHVAGTMEFQNGAIGTIIQSFDVWAHNLPRIEVYGTEGSLSVPDPNTFGGTIKVRLGAAKEWTEKPFTHGNAENSRGLGIMDMALSLAKPRRKFRASGELCYHVLDVMQGFYDAAEKGKHISMKSKCGQPRPLPAGLPDGELD